QAERRGQRGEAGAVAAARGEARGPRLPGEVPLERVAVACDRVRADEGGADAVERLLGNIERADAEPGHQPLVGVRGEGRDARGPHVEPLRADDLDAVQDQEAAALRATPAELLQVGAIAGVP